MKRIFKGIRKKEQGNRFVTENIMHVITRTNRAECGAVCQNDRLSAGHIWQTRSHVYGEVKCQAEVRSDVVIHNKLVNGETCQGLLRRFVYKNTNNNEISPHNDMIIKNVKNLFPYFPISFFPKKKLRRFRIKSGMTFIKQPAFTLAEGATHVDLPPTKVKFAFTLAEVLITLGIIGIVAAMTIPTLMTHLAHKKLQSQFEKTYADLNIAARMFYAQEESSVHDADVLLYSNGTDLYRSDKVLDKFMSYFKGQTKNSETRWREFDASNNITQLNLNGTPTIKYPCDQTSVYIDLSGRLYAMDDNASKYGLEIGPKLCVDINGIDKPNRLGFDRFVFVFSETNSLVPYAGSSWAGLITNMTDENEIKRYCSYDLDSNSPAHSCAYFALKDISPSGNGSYWTRFLK